MHITGAPISLLGLLLVVLAACSTPAAMTPSDAPVVATIIVKPRIATSESSAVMRPIQAALGQAAGSRYARPMAGDAHIVYLTAPAQRSEVPQLIERLKASGAFQYVELDSMMKIE